MTSSTDEYETGFLRDQGDYIDGLGLKLKLNRNTNDQTINRAGATVSDVNITDTYLVLYSVLTLSTTKI